MSADVLVVHGPNLNMLGSREPEHYGSVSLAELDARLARRAEELGLSLLSYQSNEEGQIVSRLQQAAADGTRGVLLNPAAFTHTSVAIRDTVLAVALPTIEVHLTNPDSREEFRRTNFLADVVHGRVAGFGVTSYELALDGLSQILQGRNESVK